MMKITAQSIAAMAERIAKDLTMDDKPRMGKKEVEGSPVRKRDRIKMVISDEQMMGDMSYYGVQISNPNRGATYFGINDEADLDKLEASFKSAIEKMKSELKAHRQAVRKFYDEIDKQHADKGEPSFSEKK
jgi:hypothetical protein